ncbi:hypothetical protein [Saccharopolyspora erythraea]|uniref:hypothetical protein n=1 Tax=Saccharopolyspora erythraea TaxID=1836 RepID=UPI002011EADA|nr:hypothetical protein [Saccharopolyspora erythraea]
MRRKLVTGVAAASMAVLSQAPAHAQEPGVKADIDGDGRADPVSLRQVSDDQMLLRAGLSEEFTDAVVQGNARGLPLIPVDVDGDGTDEVMVPESVGANTVIYTTWRYTPEAGLHPVRTADGKPLGLAEGGGARALSTYGCTPAPDARLLVAVNAFATPDDSAFEGERVTYSVRDGIATLVTSAPVQGAGRDDPQLQADPATCAPLD